MHVLEPYELPPDMDTALAAVSLSNDADDKSMSSHEI